MQMKARRASLRHMPDRCAKRRWNKPRRPRMTPRRRAAPGTRRSAPECSSRRDAAAGGQGKVGRQQHERREDREHACRDPQPQDPAGLRNPLQPRPVAAMQPATNRDHIGREIAELAERRLRSRRPARPGAGETRAGSKLRSAACLLKICRRGTGRQPQRRRGPRRPTATRAMPQLRSAAPRRTTRGRVRTFHARRDRGACGRTSVPGRLGPRRSSPG